MMFVYYLDLARRSLRRNVALTALMILAIAFGVGASMTTLTVLRMLSADPIPGHSHVLYKVQVESRKSKGYQLGEEPPDMMTRTDAEALLRAAKADRQALMVGGGATIQPERTDLHPFFADSRWTSADFFAMFRVPFLAGSAWTADDDQRAARVVVIARSLADTLFGTSAVIGRSLRVDGAQLRIVGVIDDWQANPRFYDLNSGRYGRAEVLYVPFSTWQEIKPGMDGAFSCWADQAPDRLAYCVWIQLWVELDSPAKVAAYHDYLVHYSEEQQRLGRFQRPVNVRLRDAVEWLEYNEVVPDDARLQMWIALAFLLVCLVNTMGLLLTKFMGRSAEIGVRRALGASKRSIFIQLLVEAGSIGIVGGAAGLGLAALGIWAVHQQPTDYAALAHLDMPMLAATVVLAVISSLLAGLFPAWRGCQIEPGAQLKSQ
jgi:putative ABC transport system permease protein